MSNDININYEVLDSFGGLDQNSLLNQLLVQADSADEIEPIPQSMYYNLDDFSISLTESSTQDFTIVSLNSQSLRAKFDQIRIFMETNDCRIDVLILQETWLGINDNTSYLHINGYDFISTPKRISGHGGLAMYVKSTLSSNISSNLDPGSDIFEAQFIEITIDSSHKKLLIGNVYRPPKDNIENYSKFIEEFSQIMSSLSRNNTNVVIGGDFNLNLLQINNKPIFHEFIDAIFTNAFLPQITLPTRFSEQSGSLLDNFFTKVTENSSNSTSGVILTHISDHLPIFTKIPLKLKGERNRGSFTFVTNHNAESNFIDEIKETDFHDHIDTGPDANASVNYHILSSKLEIISRKHFSKRQIKIRHYKHKKSPWVTYEIIRSIRYKDKLYKKYKSTPTDSEYYITNKINFTTYSKIIKKMIREAKQKYYQNYFSRFRNDISKTWSKINEIIGKRKNKLERNQSFSHNNTLISDEHIISEKFNDFFCNIAENIEEHDSHVNDNGEFRKYLDEPNMRNFQFSEIGQKEVLETVKELSSKTSSGHDHLSTSLLKKIIGYIHKELTIIINQMIKSSIFPNDLKVAKIIPIYKKGNPELFTNYRPIALLPAISKVFEKILSKQIHEHFINNSLFINSQYGYRPQHSTQLAALELATRISEQLEAKKTPFNVYIDLSKAFDMLDHDILLEKLKCYGFHQNAVQLCRSYLQNREQYVDYNGKTSTLLNVRKGVPQGSILGPLFFIIFVNDLPKASKIFHSIMYADDTTLLATIEDFDYSKNNNITEINRNICSELDKVSDWLKCNKLILNAAKTKFMVFRTRGRGEAVLTLEINQTHITQVTEFNFLGIIFDEHLSWKSHIDALRVKLSRAIGVLNRLKNFLPNHILRFIYFALIHSHISYGQYLWGYVNDKISFLQKKAVRIITHSNKFTHTSPIFKSLNVLKYDDMLKLQELKFFFQLEHNLLPGYFEDFVSRFTRNEFHNTRLSMVLTPVYYRLSFMQKSFKPNLINTINTLDQQILQKVYSHSLEGLVSYTKNNMLSHYETECRVANCFACLSNMNNTQNT